MGDGILLLFGVCDGTMFGSGGGIGIVVGEVVVGDIVDGEVVVGAEGGISLRITCVASGRVTFGI